MDLTYWLDRRLSVDFFSRTADEVSIDLLGKVICVVHESLILTAQIIETEAYFIHEKASHASLGFTEKRKALFMAPGTIYMYHSRAGASLNVSCAGDGNAVLIKSAIVYPDESPHPDVVRQMQIWNPTKHGMSLREVNRLCSGQALLCRSLRLTVADWDQQSFNERFFIAQTEYQPLSIFCTPRLGIPKGRDDHLNLRFIDAAYHHRSTQKVSKISLLNSLQLARE
jgi:DNA-3-methyladenine glycosylase